MPLSTPKKESNVAPTMGAGVLDDSCRTKIRRVVVLIIANDKSGTGSIVASNDSLPWLLTCHHVIPSEKIAKECKIYFDWESVDQTGTCVSGGDLFDSESSRSFITWPSPVNSESEESKVSKVSKVSKDLELDCSLIPLKASAIPGDKERDYLSLDQHRNPKFHALKEEDQVHLFHYPAMPNEKFVRQENSYRVKFLEGYLIGHQAETQKGSSGCPVLKEFGHELVLVGMHTGSIDNLMEIELKQEINVATNIEEIHKLCTTRGGYTLPAIDVQKVLETLQKDEPKTKALKKVSSRFSIYAFVDDESSSSSSQSSTSDLATVGEDAASRLGIVAALDLRLSKGTSQQTYTDKFFAGDPPDRRLQTAFLHLQPRLAGLLDKHIYAMKPFLRASQENGEWPCKLLEVVDIEDAIDVQTIFNKIRIENCWLNTEILIRLIHLLPDSEAKCEAKKLLENYHQLLEVFSKFVLVKHIPQDDARSEHFRSSLFPKLMVTYDVNIEEFDVSKLLKHKKFLSRMFSISEEAFHYLDAKPTESTLVIWAMAISREKAKSMFESAQHEFWSLKECSVIKVELEGVFQLDLRGLDLPRMKKALQCNQDFLAYTEHVSHQFLALVDYSHPKRKDTEVCPVLSPLYIGSLKPLDVLQVSGSLNVDGSKNQQTWPVKDEQRTQPSAVDGQRTQPSAVDGQRTQPSAVDEQRTQPSAVDEPRTQALREAYDELKSAYPEHIKPGRVPFINLVVVKRQPRRHKTKKDIQQYLKATALGIDHYSKSTERIDYENILTSSENENNSTRSDSGKRLVIAGPPGSGKTTLAKKLCRDLCSGHLPNRYQLVLFADLKDFRMYLERINKKAGLLTLLEYSGLPRADTLCSIVEGEAGQNVAVILDGYDEISDDKLLSAWVSQLFSHELHLRMSSCDVFITTRPSQLAQLIEAASSHIEIQGFVRSDIEHYINAYFQDAPHTAKNVIHRLRSLPLVHGLCSNPIVLEITCRDFEHPEVEEPLPSNLSGMFLRHILLQLNTDLLHTEKDLEMERVRHIRLQLKTDLLHTERDLFVEMERVRDLLDVPQDLFPGFYTLCRLAYQCCRDQQLLLKEEELKKEKILKYVDKQGSLYNLLFAEPVRSPSPIPCVLYQSHHETVTEALAAVHTAVLPKAEQQQIWEEQFAVPHMAQVWMMYCELTGLKSVDLRRLSSLTVSERGREVIKGVVGRALDDEDMLLMVSLHEANNSEVAKRVLPAVLKNTITADIKSSYDAMVVGNAITHHPNLQTVELDLANRFMPEIDLQPLNAAENVKSVKLRCYSVAHMQAVLPKNVEEVELDLELEEHTWDEQVEALRAYQCLHSLTLRVNDFTRHLYDGTSIVEWDDLFNNFDRLTVFHILYQNNQGPVDPLNASEESLQHLLVPRVKCSLEHELTPHQLSAVLVGLMWAHKLNELGLHIKTVDSEVSPNQCLISSDEVEELVATHPQLVKVDVSHEEHNDLLLAVAKGAIKNKNITHLGLGEYESLAVLPLLRSPSADHITSVSATVDFSTRPDDGEWIDLLLGGAMSRATCQLTLDVVTAASLGALLSRVHTVPKLTDLSVYIESWRDDDQTLVDVPGVEAAFRDCQLKRLRIELDVYDAPPQVYPLCGAVLCGIAANSTAQVDTCIYWLRNIELEESFHLDQFTGQLPQQTLERFEVVKTSYYSFIISRDAACPSASRSAPITPSPPTTTTPEDTSSGQDPSSKPQPMTTGPVSPPEHPATPVSFQELLKKYRDRIYSDVVSTAVSARLEMEEVISAEVAREVKDKGDKKGNCLVYLHLLNQGDFQSLRTFSIVLKEEAGNPKMQKLGEELLAELDLLLPAPSSSLPS